MKTTRREFLKFLGALTATAAVSPALAAADAVEGAANIAIEYTCNWQKWIYEAYAELNPTYPDWPVGGQGLTFCAPLDPADMRIIRLSLDIRLAPGTTADPAHERCHVGMELLQEEMHDRGIVDEVRFKEFVTEKLEDMVAAFTRFVNETIAGA